MSAGRPFDSKELIAQIGYWNVMAISGGRVTNIVNDEGDTVQVLFPVGNGYRVSVELDWDDTYIVKRQYVRKGVVTDRGAVVDVYCDEVGEVAYKASCFRNVEFGYIPDSKNALNPVSAGADHVGADEPLEVNT